MGRVGLLLMAQKVRLSFNINLIEPSHMTLILKTVNISNMPKSFYLSSLGTRKRENDNPACILSGLFIIVAFLMSSPQKKQAQFFTIIFMQEEGAQFPKVRLSIPLYKKMKNIYQYLAREKCNPFKSFFLTNKLKERAQFSEEREIKEIKEEFRKDKQGNYVILCYEDKTKSAPEAKKKEEQKEDLRETRDGKEAKEPKEEEKDGGCNIM